MKYKYIIIFCLVSLISCNEDDPNVKQTNTKDLAGEWFVTYTYKGDDVGGGYSSLITSNTVANSSNELFITDWVDPNASSGNFASFKVKASADLASKTFSVNGADSFTPADTFKINIKSGQVFKGGGMSKSKVVVDSIYFEIAFENDDNSLDDVYIVSGHKRTGFTEDEY